MFASSEVLGTSAVMFVSLGQRPFHVSMAQRLCGVVRPSCNGKLVAKVLVLEHSQNQRCERKCTSKQESVKLVCVNGQMGFGSQFVRHISPGVIDAVPFWPWGVKRN